MKCPVCNVELRIAERQGVEIDYCPQCRGVWLDRGELDKIIACAESQVSRAQEQDEDEDDRYEDRDSHQSHDRRAKGDGDYGRRGDGHHGGRKREGFLSNLFDMFGD